MENIDETKKHHVKFEKMYLRHRTRAQHTIKKSDACRIGFFDSHTALNHRYIPVVELPHLNGSAAAMVVPASVLSSTHTLPP